MQISLATLQKLSQFLIKLKICFNYNLAILFLVITQVKWKLAQINVGNGYICNCENLPFIWGVGQHTGLIFRTLSNKKDCSPIYVAARKDLEFVMCYTEQMLADLECCILWFHLDTILEMAKDVQKPHQCLPDWRWERVIYQVTESQGTTLSTSYSGYD